MTITPLNNPSYTVSFTASSNTIPNVNVWSTIDNIDSVTDYRDKISAKTLLYQSWMNTTVK